MVRCDVQRWNMQKQIDATRYIVSMYMTCYKTYTWIRHDSVKGEYDTFISLQTRQCPVIDTPWTVCSNIIVNPYRTSSVVTRVPSSQPDLGLECYCMLQTKEALKYPVSYRVAISIRGNMAP